MLTVIARMPRRASVIAAAVLAVVVVVPATASAQVRAGKSVGVFGNLDFVAAFGYQPGENLTVEVFRGDHRIGVASGAAQDIDEGLPLTGAIEVNHGPAGAPLPGDCWTNYTPDIQPGDRVSVTGDGGTDNVLVDDIRVTQGMFALGVDDVAYEGIAIDANGDPIDVARLDSGEVRADGAPTRVRANPTSVEAIPGVPGGWRAIHSPPGYGAFVGQNLDSASIKAALLDFGDPAMGYGHIAPPPPVVQLAEGLGGGGPALGCEASIAAGANRATNTSIDAINQSTLANPAGLRVAGVSGADIGNVSVRLEEIGGAGNVTQAAVVGDRAWTATFTPAQLASLADGTIRIRAVFDGANGNTLAVAKDTIAPGGVFSTPGPGTYSGAQAVSLSTGNSSDVVRFTRNGTLPTASSEQAFGTITIPSSQTITAVATDPAGNTGPASTLAFTITPAQGGGGGGGGAQPAAPAAPAAVAPVAIDAPRPLFLGMLSTSPTVKRSKAAANGIRLAMRLPEGTEVVRIRIYRITGSGRRLISSGFKTPGATGLYRARQNHRSLRRSLKTLGRYVAEVTPGRSRTDLGTTSRYGFRIVR